MKRVDIYLVDDEDGELEPALGFIFDWFRDWFDESRKARAQEVTSEDIDWNQQLLGSLLAGGGLGLLATGAGGALVSGLGRSLPWLGSYYATFGQSYGAGQQLSREWLAFSMDRDEWFRNQRNV